MSGALGAGGSAQAEPQQDAAQAAAAPSIKKLAQATVNRIAAGEVIHRPANALKELLENSIDAKATQITVMAKSGGLKLLQVTDDGHGIRKDDLAIAVERFTTSKLKEYEDLEKLDTFGFRGEALASMSHVAHLSITTMTEGSKCAWKAHYADSKLVPSKPGESPDPKPCAGVKGTIITIEDLFYNVPNRRKALKNPSEEYQKIVDVVGRYAIRFPHVSFTCKRQGENSADVRTSVRSTSLDNIKNVYGAAVSRELLELSAEDEALKVKVEGLVSNGNHSSKRMVMILFINGRLVESSPIRRCVEQVYLDYLPKGSHPFVYLNLTFPPANLDVNVHPTKNEVRFMDEEQVVDFIEDSIGGVLKGANSSRSFLMQTLLPGADAVDGGEEGDEKNSKKKANERDREKRADNKMVRVTAATEFGQMDAFVFRVPGTTDKSQSRVTSKRQHGEAAVDVQPARPRGGGSGMEDGVAAEEEAEDLPPTVRKRARSRRETKLSSVRSLIAKCEGRSHEALTDVMRGHNFVGCVSQRLGIVQHGTKLYMCDLPKLTREAFYQACLRRFGDHDRITLRTPGCVKTLVRAVLDTSEAGWTPEDGGKDEIADYCSSLLCSDKGEMLDQYFGMGFKPDGTLSCLPELIDNYIPPLGLLPMFLLRLAVEVDWDNEERCFDGVSNELASFYSVRPGHTDLALPEELRRHVRSKAEAVAKAGDACDAGEGGATSQQRSERDAAPQGDAELPKEEAAPQGDAELPKEEAAPQGDAELPKEDAAPQGDAELPKEDAAPQGDAAWRWCVQHVLFPGMRYVTLPPRSFASDGTMVQLVCTSQLYRVFERC